MDKTNKSCRYCQWIVLALVVIVVAILVVNQTKPGWLKGFFGLASGDIITVNAGGNLQAAIDSAQCGDTILLQAGATYNGGFRLRNRGSCTDTSYITISYNPATVPSGCSMAPPGTRVNPAVHACAMPKLKGSNSGAVDTDIGANHYRFIGIEFTNDGSVNVPDIVDFGASTNRIQRAAMVGFDIDRCFIHPHEISASNLFPNTLNRSAGRGVLLNIVEGTVQNSYIAGFAGKYLGGVDNWDSYGIYSPVGPGPLHIINNYIEAQFNNIFIGGGNTESGNTAIVSNPTTGSATFSNVANLEIGHYVSMRDESLPSADWPSDTKWQVVRVDGIVGNVVSYHIVRGQYSPPAQSPTNGGLAQWNGDRIHDVEIRRNYLNKPAVWDAFSSPKAFIELKDCKDCIIDGNDMYASAPAPQAFTARNQTGSAGWVGLTNVTFSNNRIDGYQNFVIGSQLTDNERPSQPSGPIFVINNLFMNERGVKTAFAGMVGGNGVTFTHNTVLQTRAMFQDVIPTNHGTIPTDDYKVPGFVFQDNVVNIGEFGPQCGFGNPLSNCFPNYVIKNNVMINNQADRAFNMCGVITGLNYCVDNQSLVKFVNPAAGDYRLAADSPYKGKAFDGSSDPGVNMSTLLAALGGSTPPLPPPPSDTTPPSVFLTAPANGATVSGSVSVSANASDNVGVTKVEFSVDGSLKNTDISSPYFFSFDTTTLTNGNHTIQAKAYDALGNNATSSISVTVNNTTTPPPSGGEAVSWTNLVNATASGGTIQGTAAGNSGGVSSQQITSGDGYMEFTASETTTYRWAGLTKSGSAVGSSNIDFAINLTSAPYSGGFVANIHENGQYVTDTTYNTGDVLRVAVVGGAVKYSKNGSVFFTSSKSPTYPLIASAYLGNVGATVSNAVISSSSTPPSDTTPPSIFLTSPTSGSTLSGTTTISATATDNVAVTGVQFKLDGTNLGSEDVSSPYSISWNTTTASNGSHTLTATARDAAGNSTTSSAVTVTVNNITTPPTNKFIIGDRVHVTVTKLNVRPQPAKGKSGFHYLNDLGTVIGGPITASGLIWWNINFDTAPDGWAAQDYLAK